MDDKQLKKVQSWLTARYLEGSLEPWQVNRWDPKVYYADDVDEESERSKEERFQSILIPRKPFHEFLLSENMDIQEAVYECHQRGWIRVELNFDTQIPFYRINPAVTESAKVKRSREAVNPNDPRDKYIYEAWNLGLKVKAIMDHIKTHKDWELPETLNGIKKAGNRYAGRHKLNPLKPRR